MKVVLYAVLSIIVILGISIAVFADDETDKEQTPTEATTESVPKPAAEAAPKEKGVSHYGNQLRQHHARALYEGRPPVRG